ncbi:hypothetical protein DLEV_033 [Diachasmimorpha longicaudata entomopoxvirus]|uniref:Uncharacterized protein n=1 Tax=Diachasmimorpha longicaudata entomopoxvirus TaxID=109981 RepID=A0A7R5WMC2_9POXV|nr:hypothetical protein QKK69_gp033 [Diachasmimorpha longicaudata entomopoxvirus]AKS26324.1 hypothetical protein DLEV_033 [Diachasmimorpha longicaudata entomopoxvirus]
MDSLPNIIDVEKCPILPSNLSLESDIIRLIYDYNWKQFDIRFKLLFKLDEQKNLTLRQTFDNPNDQQLRRFRKYISVTLEKCTDLQEKNKLFQQYLAPELKLISPTELNETPNDDIIRHFLEKGIYLMFVTYIHVRNNSVKSFKAYYQKANETESVMNFIKTKAYMAPFFEHMQSLFQTFYFYIINKYAKSSFFVFPLQTDQEILLTEISTSGVFGGQNDILDTTLETSLLKDKLEEKALEPNIINQFTSDQVQNMETILENKNINFLIKNNKLKLSDDLDKLVHITENKEPVKKDMFERAFITDPTDLDNLYQAYEKCDQKDLFLRYMVDKISYYQNTNQESVACMKSVENIFEKILQSNFDKNNLHLQSDDMKFILMLETLDKLRNMFAQPQGNNITVNLFSDEIKKAKINDDVIDLKK